MHWFHWGVVALSLVLTLAAWSFSKRQVEEKVTRQFDRQSQQVVDLVLERMRKYEVALWSGVAFWNSIDHEIRHQNWQKYADSIKIGEKFPGINGIGLIRAIRPEESAAFVAARAAQNPEFRIYPEHDEDILFPITYIEPETTNAQALGLDMAHEDNRHTATLRAMETGSAQITGPIFLVQEDVKTPGFLFFAPKYRGNSIDASEDRAAAFEGMVYAPFVVERLMRGVLAKEKRHVGIRLSDGDQEIYNELDDLESDFDPDPQHKKVVPITMYGRVWNMEVWSSRSFRSAQSDSQPTIILVGGLMIDSMLIFLFIMMSRGSRRSLAYADAATKELKVRNGELEQFVYTASHDLKSPLISLQGFAGFLKQDIDQGRHDRLGEFVDRIQEGTIRMRACIDDILDLCKVGRVKREAEQIETRAALTGLVVEMQNQIDDAGARVLIEESIPPVMYDRGNFLRVFENLIANALKYGKPSEGEFVIRVGCEEHGRMLCLFVQDNGPGIEEEYQAKIFDLFQRLQSGGDGTGVGLAIVKRIAEMNGGKAWIETPRDGGARFVISIPRMNVQPKQVAA